MHNWKLIIVMKKLGFVLICLFVFAYTFVMHTHNSNDCFLLDEDVLAFGEEKTGVEYRSDNLTPTFTADSIPVYEHNIDCRGCGYIKCNEGSGTHLHTIEQHDKCPYAFVNQ